MLASILQTGLLSQLICCLHKKSSIPQLVWSTHNSLKSDRLSPANTHHLQ